MCERGHRREVERRALCYLRFFVYREYREIRYLGNPETGRYDKFSDRCSELYELDRKSFASLWYQIVSETDPAVITKPFEDRTGLTLQEVEEAFRWGDWYQFGSATKNYGGLKHAEIVLHTIQLGDAITAGRWADLVPHELAVLRDIEHNRPRPARLDYPSLLADLQTLALPVPRGCCLVDAG